MTGTLLREEGGGRGLNVSPIHHRKHMLAVCIRVASDDATASEKKWITFDRIYHCL